MTKATMLRESVSMSLTNIASNKMRSFLTILGVIIGVTAIISLITIVNGVTGELTDRFNELGTGTLSVTASGTPLKRGLTQTDMDEILLLDNVSGISPSVSSIAAVKHGSKWSDEVSLNGRNSTWFIRNDGAVERGRAISPLDVRDRTRVCLINNAVREALFFGEDPLGQSLLVNGHTFMIVGMLADDADSSVMAQAMGGGKDMQIAVPYTTAMRMTGQRYVSSLDVYVTDTQRTSETSEALKNHLHAVFNYKDDTYTVINMESLLDTMNTMLSMMTGLLAGIASIALLVGGIGIMNMMLVSVTERTAEIGLRKALGAEPYQIQVQFLIEAFTLSVLGGLLGAALGVTISYVFAVAIDVPFRISWFAIGLGVGFAAAVGIVFGWAPARKASNLNPIDALRSV